LGFVALSLKAGHLKRYKDIVLLLWKYGRSDLVKSAGLDDALGDELPGTPGSVNGNAGIELAADLERLGSHVQAGDIVLLRTDWPRKCPVESERFWREAPYTGRSACDWLVAHKVKAVGYDYPPDYAVRTTIFEPGKKVTRYECTTHDVFFPAGITVIEYLTHLDQIGAPRCRFIALPLKLDGADGSPVRAIALLD